MCEHDLRRRNMPVNSSFSRTVVCAVALLCIPLPAYADAYEAAFAHAIAAKERALDSNDPAAWDEALERLRRADALRETKECKYELAQAAARLRQQDLAFEAFESSLALGLEGSAAEKARAFLTKHGQSLGRLNILGPQGTTVRIANRHRGTLPLAKPLVVFAGETAVELSLGSRSVTRTARIASGIETFLDARLAFAKTPEQPKPTPRLPPDDPVAGPETTSPHPASPWLLGAGIGVAATGAVTVILSSVTISSRRDDLKSHCEIPDGSDGCRFAQPALRDSAQSDVDALATWKGVRVAGWIGVGVGVGLGSLGLLLPRSQDPKPTAGRLHLQLTPRSIAAHGTF